MQVTKDGRIVDEGIIRMNAARKQHKHFSRELLADTIVTKAVELEVSRRANVLPNHTLVQTAHFHTNYNSIRTQSL